MNDAKIKILIPRSVKNKIDDYINLTNAEISGLGDVEKVQDGVFRIKEVYLYKQTCTGGSTSIENTAVHDFIVDRLAIGGSVENVKFWWHSHYTMGVFWSGQDENAIQNIENDYLISMVQNHRGDIKTRIDLFQPFRTTIHDVAVEIEEDTISSLDSISPIEESHILVPLAECINEMISIFGTDFNLVTMTSFLNSFEGRTSFFNKTSEYFKAYSDIIQNCLEEMKSRQAKIRQIPIQEEINNKVTISSSPKFHYLPSVSDRFHRNNSRSFGHEMAEDDWFSQNYGLDAMDMLDGFNRKIDSDFKNSLDKDTVGEFKRPINETHKSSFRHNSNSGFQKIASMGDKK